MTAVSCRLGASYAGARESTVAALDRYGRNLGIAFQIADDVLDIWGEERVTGKSLGTDLEKQKLTLPIIHLLRLVEPATAATIRGLLTDADPESATSTPTASRRDRMRSNYAWQRAKQHVKQAVDALDCLPDSEAKAVLRHPRPVRRPARS